MTPDTYILSYTDGAELAALVNEFSKPGRTTACQLLQSFLRAILDQYLCSNQGQTASS